MAELQTTLPESAEALRPETPLPIRLLRNPRASAGLILIVVLYLLALFAPLLAPNPDQQDLIVRLSPPSIHHLFGTDEFGRDVLSRVLWGGRISLAISVVATLIAVSLGTAVGLVSGYLGGWMDNVVMRTTDAFIAFPLLVLLITAVSLWGSSLVLLVVFLGLAAWPYTARLVRAEVLSHSNRDYVLAARSLGAGNLRVMAVHLLPNVIPVVIISATIRAAFVILIEAALSYLGLGVQPPAASWGNIIADGQAYIETAWWISTFPGVFIVLTVVAYNLIGDGLRDVFDPSRRLADR